MNRLEFAHLPPRFSPAYEMTVLKTVLRSPNGLEGEEEKKERQADRQT